MRSFHRLTHAAVLVTLAGMAPAAVAQESAKPFLLPAEFANLQELIKPAPGEARWKEVPWLPSSDIWAARKKAAAEGKPLFLWYMAGEPLGTC